MILGMKPPKAPTSTSRADYTEKLSESRHLNSRYRDADAVGATRERGRYLGVEDLGAWVERVRERCVFSTVVVFLVC